MFTVIAPLILGLGDMAGENRDRIDKVDPMLEDVGVSLGFVPFEIHALY